MNRQDNLPGLMQRMQRVRIQAFDPLNTKMVVVCPVEVADSRSVLVSIEDLCDDVEHGVMVYIPGASWDQNYAMFYDQIHKGRPVRSLQLID